MKRKDPHRNGLDPRVLSWQKYHRDQFPGVGDRVWLKSEQCHGRIVVAAAAALPQEVQEGREDQDATNSTDRPHGSGIGHDQGVDKKLGSLEAESLGSIRMVQLENAGSTVTTLRRPHDAVRVYDPPAIVICHSTEDFRLLAQTQDIGESVLEIGCSTGQTSRILWQRCDQWMGWDTGQAMVDKLRDEIATKTTKDHRCTALTCCKIDAIIDPENAWKLVNDHFCQTSRGLTVLIDIGGNREVNAVAKILQWALEIPNNKELRLVIIKSEEMFALEDPLNWFLTQQDISVPIKTFPSHPLKAPKRCSPQDPSLPVCRYYNYHKEGCKKGAVCELDHTHCHWCLTVGHIALNCPDR
jgi:SAM-dependent methyltransferase